jgi:hypothetical protein
MQSELYYGSLYVSKSVLRLGYELDDRGMRLDSGKGKEIFCIRPIPAVGCIQPSI